MVLSAPLALPRRPVSSVRQERKALRKAPLTLKGFLADHYGPRSAAHHKPSTRAAAQVRAVFRELLGKPLKDITARAVEKHRCARPSSRTTRIFIRRLPTVWPFHQERKMVR